MTTPILPDLWSFFQSPGPTILGWTLLHFLWQGALMAALLAGVLHLLRRHSPEVRYGVSVAAMVALVLLPIGTGTLLSTEWTAVGVERSVVGAEGATPERTVVARSVRSTPPAEAPSIAAYDLLVAWLEPALPWIAFGWAVGVLAFSIRLAGGAWRVRRLRHHSAAAPSVWRVRLQRLATQFGLQGSVALRRTQEVDGPMVVGWWRPVILVPAGLLSGMAPDQVEALLMHELAHVRRHDVLVARLQAVVEVLLFFHPATWWISEKVRQSREACCDAAAVQRGTDRTVYAHALATLAERAGGRSTAGWAPAAHDGSLLGRIRSILSPDRAPSSGMQRLSLVTAVSTMLMLSVGLAACASQQASTERESNGASTAASSETDGSEGGDPTTEMRESERVVIRTDSTHESVHLRSDEWARLDTLDEDIYVLRRGGTVDTLDLPQIPDIEHIDSLARAIRIDTDSIERFVRLRIRPDSLARALEARINPDSLERVLRMRINPDSLERRALRVRLRADSLARLHRQHADSLHVHLEKMRERMEREVPERLREQARHLREQAKRLEERADELEPPEPPPEPTRPDSAGSE